MSFSETDKTDAEPFVRVEKERFAEDEQIFFWVGVTYPAGTTAGTSAPIPRRLWDTCRLIIVRPDGTRKTERSSWPRDGIEGGTWQGGAGIGEAAVPGRYAVLFEFAGKTSAPATFVVERSPLLSQIHGAFVFGPAPGERVTLTVHNGSDRTIRFPHRGGDSQISGSDIWVHLTARDEGQGARIHFFYPSRGYPPASGPRSRSHYDSFTWTAARAVPAVVLMPGETYRLPLSLTAAITEARRHVPLPPGLFAVLFGTTLSILAGEPGSSDSALYPVRLVVESKSVCTIPPMP